jgi:hypothetical protein
MTVSAGVNIYEAKIPRKLRCGETPSLRTGKNKKGIISL